MILEVKNLTKSFGKSEVLSNLSFSFSDNQIVSIIGPNGSGKTTLLRCLTDIYKYSGDVEFYGKSLNDNQELKNSIGFVQDNDTLDRYLTGREYAMLISGLYSDNASRTVKLEKLSELFDIHKDLDKPLSSYSHGMTKKISIISSLLFDSKILFLDEPFNGLDPEYVIILSDLLLGLSKQKLNHCTLKAYRF
jgi:ABC-2 type transport system ATP-binding protein